MRRVRKRTLAAVAVIILMVGLPAIGWQQLLEPHDGTSTGQSKPPAVNQAEVLGTRTIGPGRYRVVGVADGDTIKIDYNGKRTTVRLIGVNTPESVDPRRPVQCYGKEAAAWTKQQLTGQTVVLEADPSQANRDKYGRLLRYVFLPDGTNFNQYLITNGYAYEYTYDNPYKYQAAFRRAQSEAQQAKRGLWADNTCAGQANAPVPGSNLPASAPPARRDGTDVRP